MEFKLTSTPFAPGEAIPARHTCDGEDLSPELKWTGLPPGSASLALICDDPDAPAGTWTHWVLFDLPASVTELAEGVPTTEVLANGAKQGRNDFKRVGYGGPCPPPGGPHRYFFRLYALNASLNLRLGAGKQEVLDAMKGHIAGQAELIGTYKRKR